MYNFESGSSRKKNELHVLNMFHQERNGLKFQASHFSSLENQNKWTSLLKREPF